MLRVPSLDKSNGSAQRGHNGQNYAMVPSQSTEKAALGIQKKKKKDESGVKITAFPFCPVIT